jgi:hypothetical protein
VIKSISWTYDHCDLNLSHAFVLVIYLGLTFCLCPPYRTMQLREVNTGSTPAGVSVFLQALTTWNYDESPLDALDFEVCVCVSRCI